MAFEFARARFTELRNPALAQIAAGVRAALADIADPQAAEDHVQAIDHLIRAQQRRVHFDIVTVIQVRDRKDGRLLFRSPANLELGPVPVGYSRTTVAGATFYVYCEQDEHWEFAFAQARLGTLWLLRQLSSDMTIDILIAFPLIVVPVWLAVRLGVRPLRNLANSIAKRGPDDLSPVVVARRHVELVLLADAFNLQLARVLRLLTGERAFVQDAAHELRTPMAVVAVNAHAVTHAEDPVERAAAEMRLHSGLARASHLVEQLLLLTRLDAARPNEILSENVVSLIREELAALAPAALAKNIELALESPESLQALIESHTLRSIVSNLVDNAIRYGLEGGHVLVTVESAGEEWTLRVSDDGIGIPPTERERVFERFYRGDDGGAHGTGLGLAIVRAAATRLGVVVLISDGIAGRGCTFLVRFPPRQLFK
jgi:signal transduction histidine kinase